MQLKFGDPKSIILRDASTLHKQLLFMQALHGIDQEHSCFKCVHLRAFDHLRRGAYGCALYTVDEKPALDISKSCLACGQFSPAGEDVLDK